MSQIQKFSPDPVLSLVTETGPGIQILSSSPSSSTPFHARMVELAPPPPPPPAAAPAPLPEARPGELRECYYNLANRGSCSLLATNTTQQECCCTAGEGWGLGCQYHTCPPANTGEERERRRMHSGSRADR